ncbi:MAG: ABC transporter ATP-binding protein [Actinobacteria bacterium]|nr:ABC transporter ATP-binding protein [Actinomycetota bacterium]
MQHVDKSFQTKSGAQHVLRDIDLTVQNGEFVCFIGHSGCGKSTLLNVVAGLTQPDSGTVWLNQHRVTVPGPDRAMVFQNYSLLPWLSLLDNVREAVFAARPDRSSPQNEFEVERYLKSVGLWEQRQKRPAQTSGGMQQRTAVARAFAVGPKVLLLDEPFGALDALTRARLQQELLDLCSHESGTEIVLMVTHGIDEAAFLADRIVVMAGPPHDSVAAIIDVDIPKPRDRVTIGEDPTYRAVCTELTRLLTGHLAPEAAAA